MDKRLSLRLRGYAYLLLMAIYVIAIWFTVLNIMGCTELRPTDHPITVLTAPAGPQQCSNGGTVVSIGGQEYVVCNGANGAIGPTGQTGAIGPQGAQGPQGEQGPVGPIGSTGAQGPQGDPGQPGTQITTIQFCKGITPTYPSTFPEIGICIDNQLYAVYSANGGFMVLVTPGTYSSNGINASCTFTVGPNCEVTQ